MSRRKDNYENSLWKKFRGWVDGEVDLLADGMETVDLSRRACEDAVRGDGEKPVCEKIACGDGEKPVCEKAVRENSEEPVRERDSERIKRLEEYREQKGLKLYRRVYQVMSVLLCAAIIFVLLWTVIYLPVFGEASNPANNEVAARYIENGLQETGAVNIVTGMILDYRAFDTFGESCVLFIASCCVLVLLRIDRSSHDDRQRKISEETNDRLYEPKNDIILQKCACVLVPVILIFGIYIVLNGHLSPGGGFSGGAVLGSGLILYLNAFGFQKTGKLFAERTYRKVTLCALTFYCVAKSYSFFTGANHIPSGIPTGTPGAILSSGLILPLNICVGLVVACTMYAFYALFRKGGM